MIIKKIVSNITTSPKRVAAYCRVSTLRDEQEESFQTQKDYYTEMIQNHPEWELVKIYADRHSATQVRNRPGFQEMKADAESKKLDIIICKSISRFSRNLLDCQQHINWFRTLGITIIFEEQDIRTDEPACDLVLSLLAAVAQDESHSISRNVRAAYESRFARGEYNLGSNRILGYDCVEGTLVPNADAWIVKEIYRRFLGSQTFQEISDGLAAMGAKSKTGKHHFSAETLRYMLSNETYSAQLVLKKYLRRDYSFGWCPVWYAVKNEMIQTHGMKYPEGYLSEDVHFSFLLWKYASKVDATETFLYNYRRDNINSTTHKATFKFSNDLLQMIKLNLAIVKEQISDPELLGLVKLNFQTLVNVVLFWYTSYTEEEQKILKESILEVKEIYEINLKAKKYMKKKEKLINVLLSTIGITRTATLWGIKRKKQ